jgi:hypothetical protein
LSSSGSSSSSSKKNKEFEDGHEEAKRRRILEEYPDISKDTLEFVLSLPVERKIPKVNEKETVYASAEQQEEMERLLKKKY